jgi:alpha-L-rhamnosidase
LPGLKHFIIHSGIVGNLTSIKCSYDSAHGNIASEWKLRQNQVTLHAIAPPNTAATIEVPTSADSLVKENGTSIAKSSGIECVEFQNSVASYQVGSGNYLFKAEFSSK